jgi:hypothetical protein
MSDHTSNGAGGHHAHPARAPRAEFYAYFALIFLAALPFATVGWLCSSCASRRVPNQNPILRAWCDARTITPSIFRA